MRAADRRYAANRAREAAPALAALKDSRGRLSGQGRAGLAELAFGRSTVGRAGCEAIAVYNVLRELGRDVTLSDVIRAAETGGCLALGGRMGILPRRLPRLLDAFGLEYRRADPAAPERLPAGAFLACVWNWGFAGPLHAFALVHDGGGWTAWNRFNGDAGPRRYPALSGVLDTGARRSRFRLIYAVGAPLPPES